jgi:hypothetical protein
MGQMLFAQCTELIDPKLNNGLPVTTLEHVSQRKRSPQARCCIIDENTKLERERENTKREFW